MLLIIDEIKISAVDVTIADWRGRQPFITLIARCSSASVRMPPANHLLGDISEVMEAIKTENCSHAGQAG